MSIVPGTLWPNVLPNEAAGSCEKLTATSIALGGLPTFSVMETTVPFAPAHDPSSGGVGKRRWGLACPCGLGLV